MDLQKFVNAEFADFEALSTEMDNLYGQISGGVDGLWGMIEGTINGFLPGAIFFVLAAFAVLELFWGKKTLGVLKFVAAFVFGYAVAVTFIPPMLAGIGVTIDTFILGVAVGLLAGLLQRPIYFLAYVLAIGYPVYLFAMLNITAGTMPVALVMAAGVVVVSLMLRKVIETAGLAVLGAHCLYLSIDGIMAGGLVTMLGETEPTIKLVIVAVLGLIGFVVQWKHRRRY